ncbi:MAG: hypothetical protein ACJAZS_000566 [Alteromonas naphthalenivorans]|jgi:hypothetical protein
MLSMNNSLRYLALALLISTSTQAAEATVPAVEAVIEASAEATVPAVEAVIETTVPATSYWAAVKEGAVKARTATVDAVKSGKTMVSDGSENVVAIVKAHPGKFAIGAVAVTAIAVYAFHKWKKASRRAAELEEELAEEDALTA